MKAGSIFFFVFDSQIPAAYIRKRFNFESGLYSVKYGIYSVAGIFFYAASSDFPALSGIISKNVINISFALIYWLSGNEI